MPFQLLFNTILPNHKIEGVYTIDLLNVSKVDAYCIYTFVDFVIQWSNAKTNIDKSTKVEKELCTECWHIWMDFDLYRQQANI